MHKLMDYICDELEELERKADKDGKLSGAEIQYADTLAHLKKNLMKAEEMEMEADYSSRGYTMRTMPMYYGNSYAGRRNARRDSMGRYSGGNYSREGYSRAAEDMVDQLRDMMRNAPDEQTKTDIRRIVEKLER